MDKRRKTNQSILLLTALVLTLPSMVSGLEIQGKVVEVEGSKVKIAYESEYAPQKGDEVQIGFEIPGEGFIPVEGSWEVREVSIGYVWAEPKGSGSEPPPLDYIARILSPNPQKKSEIVSDSERLYQQGRKYEFGKGVKKDINKAFKWYRKAAEQGHAKGQSNLGVMYDRGLGVSKDFREAVKWYRRAAEQGHARGQTNLGIMYSYGRGVAKDYSEAFKWYRKAAEQGHAQGQTNLGVMYDQGKGVTRDYREAVKWYRKAAEQGYAPAQSKLGFMYALGRGVSKDYAEAVRWNRKAAERGHPNGQFNLGLMYDEGKGVTQNSAEALKWYYLAAAQSKGEFDKEAAKHRDIISKKMTPEQIAEAQRLAREWKAKR